MHSAFVATWTRLCIGGNVINFSILKYSVAQVFNIKNADMGNEETNHSRAAARGVNPNGPRKSTFGTDLTLLFLFPSPFWPATIALTMLISLADNKPGTPEPLFRVTFIARAVAAPARGLKKRGYMRGHAKNRLTHRRCFPQTPSPYLVRCLVKISHSCLASLLTRMHARRVYDAAAL